MSTSDPKVVPLIPSARADAGGGDPDDIKSPLVQEIVRRRLSREWRQYITLAEFGILEFIIDQTIGWGRADRLFSSRFIEHGDHGCCGTGVGRWQSAKVITALEAKGLIAVDRTDTTKGLVIRPNINWKPGEAMLAVSKKRKKSSDDATHTRPEYYENHETCVENHTPPCVENHTPPVWKTTHPLCGKPHTIKEEPLEEFVGDKEKFPVADARDTAPTVRFRSRPIASAAPASSALAASPPSPPVAPAPPPNHDEGWEQTRLDLPQPFHVNRFSAEERRADRERKRAGVRALSVLQPGSLEKTWRYAWEDAYEGRAGAIVRPWTGQQRGMVKQALIKGWMGKPEELHDYLTWTVAQWEWIIPTAFSWMKKTPPPALPDIGFFVSHESKFRGLYNTKTRDQWIASARSPEERLFLELTTKKGMTAEEARIEIATRKAQATMRDELAKQRAAIANETAVLREQERRLSRLQRPQAPHPSSIAAREERLREFAKDAPPTTLEEFIQFTPGPYREED